MDLVQEINKLEEEIQEKRAMLAKLRKQLGAKKVKVQPYQFTCSDGSYKSLDELFKDKDELLVIHNMGRGCAYCTMWADGFNGLLHHIENRTAIVLATPDDPQVQNEFAFARGWKFTMISTKGTTFTEDMGFGTEHHLVLGVSVFQKSEDGEIFKVNQAHFGPYDDYCSAWHLFSLLPSNKNWGPKLEY